MDELLSRSAGCAWRPRELCRPVRSDSGDVARLRRGEWSRRSRPQAAAGISRIRGQLVALPPELLRLRKQAVRGQSASLTWQAFVAPGLPGLDQVTPVTADLAVRADAERTGKLLAHGTTTCMLVARLEGQ